MQIAVAKISKEISNSECTKIHQDDVVILHLRTWLPFGAAMQSKWMAATHDNRTSVCFMLVLLSSAAAHYAQAACLTKQPAELLATGRHLSQQVQHAGQSSRPLGQFTEVDSRDNSYGSWGGSWVTTTPLAVPRNSEKLVIIHDGATTGATVVTSLQADTVPASSSGPLTGTSETPTDSSIHTFKPTDTTAALPSSSSVSGLRTSITATSLTTATSPPLGSKTTGSSSTPPIIGVPVSSSANTAVKSEAGNAGSYANIEVNAAAWQPGAVARQGNAAVAPAGMFSNIAMPSGTGMVTSQATPAGGLVPTQVQPGTVGSTVLRTASSTAGQAALPTTNAGQPGAMASAGITGTVASGSTVSQVGVQTGTSGQPGPVAPSVLQPGMTSSTGAPTAGSTASQVGLQPPQIAATGAAAVQESRGRIVGGMAAAGGGMTQTAVAATGPATAGGTVQTNPINAGVVNTQATAFDGDYCVPRQSFITVNVTALACNPGSNLTRWDDQEVCARIDCAGKLDGGNVIYAPSFCRTVVEVPRYICPDGCEVVRQTFRNTTSNQTREVTRCACRAGNQPCPGTYTGCVCQPAWIPNLNASTSYLLCGAQQGLCNTYCQRTVNTFGPLCPFFPDATLPQDPAFSGPIYPQWGWNIAAQGQATAAVAPGTPVGRRLVQLGRRLKSAVMSNSRCSDCGRSMLKLDSIEPSQRVWFSQAYGVSSPGGLDSTGTVNSGSYSRIQHCWAWRAIRSLFWSANQQQWWHIPRKFT